MINTEEILSTIEMISQQHLDIRTVTMGISLRDCSDTDPAKCARKIYDKVCRKAERLVPTAQQIERELGRKKKSQSPNTQQRQQGGAMAGIPTPIYYDRPIDIDILLYDDWIVDEPELKIPHPLMYKRDFVMIPLREIMD